MKSKGLQPEDDDELRQRAEELLSALENELQENPEGLSPKEMRRAHHELRVHQIELEMQNAELRRARAELDAERANFLDFYDFAPMGYFSISEQGLILKANLTAATMLGATRAELTQQRLHQFIHSDDQDALYFFHKKLFKTRKRQVCELRTVRNDGVVSWFQLSAIVVQEAHSELICNLAMVNIDERRASELALLKSQERLQLAIDGASDGAWDWQLDTGEAYFSPSYYKMLGYEPNEFEASFENFSKLVHPDDLAALTKAIGTSLSASETNAFEIRMRTKSGDWKWILTRSKVVSRNASGTPVRLAGTHTDITERKNAEKTLRETAARLVDAQRIAKISDWQWTPEDDHVSWSQQMFSILGVDPNSPPSTFDENLALYHCEDAQRLKVAVSQALSAGTPYELELRRTKPDGSEIYILAKGVADKDATGNVTRLWGSIQDITERKQANEALALAYATTTTILESISDAFIALDEDMVVTYFNSTAEKVLGKSQSLVIGRKLFDAFPEARGSVFDINYTRALKEKVTLDFEVNFDVPPFENWYHVRVYPHANGISVYFQVITERKQAEESLRLSNARNRLIVETANEGIMTIGVDKGIAYCNKVMLDMLGYGEELYQLRFSDLIFDEDMAQHEAETVRRMSGLPSRFERRFRRKDGTELWTIFAGAPILDEAGTYCGAFGMFTDITERKRDEELRNQIERLIHHDLRTPACGAINIAEVLRADSSLTEDSRILLDLFIDSARNMLETLDRSLDLYKIETGRYQSKLEPVDCLAVLRKVIAVLTKKIEFASINLEVLGSGNPLNSEIRYPCTGEPRLMRTALQNLLVNALEASTPGEAVVVELSLDKDCRIKIRNKGMVPVEIRNKFFDKYVTKGKLNGTGIGTYSAKLMVMAMGGDITMSTSDADNETVVTVRMPC